MKKAPECQKPIQRLKIALPNKRLKKGIMIP
jgi:hypothetical protein